MKHFFAFSMTLCLAALLTANAWAAGKQNEKRYFEAALNLVCNISDCSALPTPATEEGASALIRNGVILASVDYGKRIRHLNRAMEKLGLHGAEIIPEQLVDAAICRHYGYSVSDNKNLAAAADALKPGGNFYVSKTRWDGGNAHYKVTAVDAQQDGTLRVSGTVADAPFQATFAKAQCGKQHWVLTQVNTAGTDKTTAANNAKVNAARDKATAELEALNKPAETAPAAAEKTSTPAESASPSAAPTAAAPEAAESPKSAPAFKAGLYDYTEPSFNGGLELNEITGGYSLSITTVSHPGSHTCDFEGTCILKKGVLLCKSPDDNAEAYVKVEADGGNLVVSSTYPTAMHCGMQGKFVGTYAPKGK